MWDGRVTPPQAGVCLGGKLILRYTYVTHLRNTLICLLLRTCSLLRLPLITLYLLLAFV
jgi:hypothetical protein